MSTEKIRLEQVLVVEGKYDAAKLNDLVDGLVLTTGGFSVFTDGERQQLLRELGRRRGLLILTDSDAAGFRIRRFLNDIVGEAQVQNLYVPSVAGKESRKAHPGKEGLLGVEGIDADILRGILRQARVGAGAPKSGKAITYADLYGLGISGTTGSAEKRRRLLSRAGLPLRLSKKALLEVLNSLYTLEELTALCSDAAGETR